MISPIDGCDSMYIDISCNFVRTIFWLLSDDIQYMWGYADLLALLGSRALLSLGKGKPGETDGFS